MYFSIVYYVLCGSTEPAFVMLLINYICVLFINFAPDEQNGSITYTWL